MSNLYQTVYGSIYDYAYGLSEIVVTGGIYLGQVVCYSQTVVCNRSTVSSFLETVGAH